VSKTIGMNGINQSDFEQIFDTWYEPVLNFLYYKTGDVHAAEDLAQDTFLKVWEKRSDIRPETIRPFLYKLAQNLFLNRRNHLQVHLKFALAHQPDKVNEGPDFEMEIKEFDKKLQDAISELDDKKRTVFLMSRIEKFTYSQIAQNLGITVKAVEKRMEKALAYLKKRIEYHI
jgi:RNA polymerase sigma-70 factor (ECF subfamily)